LTASQLTIVLRRDLGERVEVSDAEADLNLSENSEHILLEEVDRVSPSTSSSLIFDDLEHNHAFDQGTPDSLLTSLHRSRECRSWRLCKRRETCRPDGRIIEPVVPSVVAFERNNGRPMSSTVFRSNRLELRRDDESVVVKSLGVNPW